jgi:hypothetical protein
MLAQQIEKYLKSRGAAGPWRIVGTHRCDFEGAAVIPALAEERSLFATLKSLAQNPQDFLDRFLVLVVVNNRTDAHPEDKADNQRTLSRFQQKDKTLERLQIGWVDACSPELELPAKKGGVGMARKIGFDLALARLDRAARPLLVSLDADTLVRPDYLPALLEHFHSAKEGGAVIPFCHQPGRTPEQDRAVQRYELYLRAYVLGLSLAGSPYAFHTVGSALACRAEAYLRIGGMNCRLAGEDFYFLQNLAKTAGVAQVRGTVVYPSPRSSSRVPFGTGQAVSRQLCGDKEAVSFYPSACFYILAQWLALVKNSLRETDGTILASAKEIAENLAHYLEISNFPVVWNKLKRNCRNHRALLGAFHEWFDGLRTRKLIQLLCRESFPRDRLEETLPDLLKWAGLPQVSDITEQLALLRKQQNGEPFLAFTSQKSWGRDERETGRSQARRI